MKLAETSVKRPVGLIMIVLGILALGFVSLRNLAVDLFPDIDLPIAAVTTTYSGAGPQEVEQLVSRPLESAISSLQGIDTIQSVSQPGASLVLLLFKTGTNLDNALLEVRERVDMVKAMLPEGADDPSVLRFDPQQIPIMMLGLTGAELDQLQEIADEQVVPYLERVNGVASATVMGGKIREIQVIPDPAILNKYGLTPSHIIQALQAENRSASAGTISKGSQEMQIRIQGEFSSLNDIAETGITLPSGERVLVSDVARVVDTFREVTSVTEVNGQEAIVLSILKESDGNTIKAADGLYKAIDQIKASLPDYVELSIVMDTSIFIRSSIKSITESLLIGGIVSILVLALFLRSLRPVFVISVSIPIAVISTFTLMYFTGETLNLISMGGLALGIGMMVDSSIVILENIFTHRQRGASLIDAATKGAAELGPAVVASTLTTMVVFLPIVFVKGIAADLMTPLALTVSFSLLASLVVALTVVPMMSSRLLTDKSVTAQLKSGGLNKWFLLLRERYRKGLDWALRHRKTVVIVTLVAFFGSFVLVPFIGAEVAPESDQGYMDIYIETPRGTGLAETEKMLRTVTARLEPYEPIIDSQYATIGSTGFVMGATVNQAILSLQLVPSTERDITTKELEAELNDLFADIAGAEIRISVMGAGLSSGDPIAIGLRGPDYEVLKDLADEVAWLVSNVEGTYDVRTSLDDGRPEIQVDVKRDMLHLYGLSYGQIMQHVNLAFNGQVATRYREGGGEYDVRIIFPEENRTTIAVSETLLIPDCERQSDPARHRGGAETGNGTGSHHPGKPAAPDQCHQQDTPAAICTACPVKFGALMANLSLPDGYDHTMGGQTTDMEETFSELGIAFLFAVFLVYVVMAVQFKSAFVIPSWSCSPCRRW